MHIHMYSSYYGNDRKENEKDEKENRFAMNRKVI